jgi:tetratricopeptide (TPR) repeat protein
LLAAAIDASNVLGDRRAELRARIEHEYVRFLHGSAQSADALHRATQEGIPTFETVGDNRALGRARLLEGLVLGGHRGQYRAWEQAAEQALEHYKRSDWPTSTCLGELGAALYYGPAPVLDGIDRCEALLRDEEIDHAGRANVQTFMGGLLGQLGEFNRGRALVQSAIAIFEDLGQRLVATTYCWPVLADLEVLAPDPIVAERILSDLCEQLQHARDFGHLASRASDLAEALYGQGRIDSAEAWTRVAEEHAAGDDLEAQALWRSARSKVCASRSQLAEAVELAEQALRLIAQTDCLNQRARVELGLATVHQLAGRAEKSASALNRARRLFEQKGNVVGANFAAAQSRQLVLA